MAMKSGQSAGVVLEIRIRRGIGCVCNKAEGDAGDVTGRSNIGAAI